MKLFLTLLLFPGFLLSWSQSITHGPIVGAATDSSCRVFVRTDQSAVVTVELSTDNTFSAISASTLVQTDDTKDTTAIAFVGGLLPDTKYYVRATISGTPSGFPAYFETLPSANTATHQVFVAGSCLYDLTDADSSLFVRAATYSPKVFFQTGDWGYPDADNGTTDIYLSNPPTSFAVDMNNHREFYRLRYQNPGHVGFLRTVSTDYIYDDHDYLNDNTAKDAASGFGLDLLGDLGAPKVYSQPPQARLNTIQAYQEEFPGYDLVDNTEGVYHSFRSGNCEFFVLDLRAMRTPQAAAIKKVNGQWVYSPPQGYSLLGANQTAWLLNGLSNSTATWKIIISSDPFNVSLRNTYDTCLMIGGGNVPYWAPEVQGFTLPNKGYTAVQNYADCWAGFRGDADTLVQHVINNNIKNVFVVSGDSHTVGLDDGENSGLPEVNSGNLKKANSQEWITNQLFMGYNVWNKGGSGLCGQSDFSNTFAKIETWGDDSLRLSAVDANGYEVAGYTFEVNAPYKFNPLRHINRIPRAAGDIVNIGVGDTTIVTVLSNDSDAENDTLYVNLQTQPAHGSVIVNSDNSITFIADQGFVGTDTFRYVVCDRANADCYNCTSAKVTVNVGPNSVENLRLNPVINVFPNPANDILLITASTDEQYIVEVFNLTGQSVLKHNGKNKMELKTDLLPDGEYLVQVVFVKSGFKTTKTVSISH